MKDRLSGRVIHGTKPGPVPYLTVAEEDELEKYVVDACELGYGKTRRQVKGIVEKVAVEKGTLRSTHVTDGWWTRFFQRHPKLSLQSGDATAHVRMNAVSNEKLKHYFSLLKKCLDENDLCSHPERIYNMDETGVPLDPKPPKVLCRKGQKKIRYRSTRNKSQITVLGCANATGQAQPPFVIFDAKQLNILWSRGEVPGTRYGLSKNGWTDQELFNGWLQNHFLKHAVQGRPLMLLIDGHSSHYDPESIRFAKENSYYFLQKRTLLLFSVCHLTPLTRLNLSMLACLGLSSNTGGKYATSSYNLYKGKLFPSKIFLNFFLMLG